MDKYATMENTTFCKNTEVMRASIRKRSDSHDEEICDGFVCGYDGDVIGKRWVRSRKLREAKKILLIRQ